MKSAWKYPSDVTGEQRRILNRLLPGLARRGHNPIDWRRVIDAILYVVRSGCGDDCFMPQIMYYVRLIGWLTVAGLFTSAVPFGEKAFPKFLGGLALVVVIFQAVDWARHRAIRKKSRVLLFCLLLAATMLAHLPLDLMVRRDSDFGISVKPAIYGEYAEKELAVRVANGERDMVDFVNYEAGPWLEPVTSVVVIAIPW